MNSDSAVSAKTFYSKVMGISLQICSSEISLYIFRERHTFEETALGWWGLNLFFKL